MSNFTANEIAYLKSQRLGRLATVNAAGEPHVVPVGFRYNAELDTIEIGRRGMRTSKKFRDAQREARVAFVVDDVTPPWSPRGIEIRGRAEVVAQGGKQISAGMDDEMLRITPTRIVSWGLDTDTYHRNSRAVS